MTSRATLLANLKETKTALNKIQKQVSRYIRSHAGSYDVNQLKQFKSRHKSALFKLGDLQEEAAKEVHVASYWVTSTV
jgi:hypothetical protein